MIRQHSRSVDVSHLPGEGFGVASPTWWGTLGFMVIEASSLAICAVAYVYLSRRSPHWPPSGTPPPSLAAGTLFLGVSLLSLIPAWFLGRAAKSLDRSAVVLWLIVGAVVETLLVAIRAYELHALPFRWDGSAYGSSVWITLGMHTTLLAFDFGETLVFLALFLSAPLQKKHFADVSDAVMYWFFVVLVWVPLYYMIYVSPRLF